MCVASLDGCSHVMADTSAGFSDILLPLVSSQGHADMLHAREHRHQSPQERSSLPLQRAGLQD